MVTGRTDGWAAGRKRGMKQYVCPTLRHHPAFCIVHLYLDFRFRFRSSFFKYLGIHWFWARANQFLFAQLESERKRHVVQIVGQ